MLRNNQANPTIMHWKQLIGCLWPILCVVLLFAVALSGCSAGGSGESNPTGGHDTGDLVIGLTDPTQPMVTVNPYLVAEVNSENPKIHRLRGPLKEFFDLYLIGSVGFGDYLIDLLLATTLFASAIFGGGCSDCVYQQIV